ncbi:hypothetical protein A7Q09_01495 [Methylacidiphilum sp. Yel]|uniref:hypothetical protein n=1 Tax=Methylacidiphilum sp. Yel TaxID=1847730 RepID=UPI0011005D27|nr:hypothetical protein [Methylacidiphilum sp. Yel]TFE67159.1 hypothetical protein A7Q09_01495 [Methylacidiphilum sp. Yel]
MFLVIKVSPLFLFIFIIIGIILSSSSLFLSSSNKFLFQPLNSSLWIQLAKDKINKDKLEEAFQILQWVRKISGPISTKRIEIAELLIECNKTDLIIPELKFVFKTDPNLRKTTIYLLKSIYGENGSKLLLDTTDLYIWSSYLEIALNEGWLEEAKEIWHQLSKHKNNIDPKLFKSYVETFIQQQDYQEARRAWDLFFPIQGLLWNGGFEKPFIGWGFDWKIYKSPFYQIKRDSQKAFSGRYSFRVKFNGLPPDRDYVIAEQRIALKEKKKYILSAKGLTKGLLSSSGVILEIYDPQEEFSYGKTSPLKNLDDWKEYSCKTKNLNEDIIALLRIRWKATTEWEIPVYGTVWIDEIYLTEFDQEENPKDGSEGEEEQEGEDLPFGEPKEKSSEESPST